MATMNVNIATSLDGFTFEGGFDSANGRTATKEIINSRVVSGTTLGPQRVANNDGDFATLGTTSDSAFAGGSNGTSIAILKSLYNTTLHNNAAGSSTSITSPPSTTNANTNTVITFSATVNHWCLQNNTSATVYYNLDATASTSTFELQAGSMVWWDWPVTAVNLFTVAAQNFNTSTNPIVLFGRA